MGTPFLGEIRIFPYPGGTPNGWALCNGQLLQINQNQALFSLLGTTYGGNGLNDFALPDMRGRVPVHTGEGLTQGQSAGEEAHTLTSAEMPTHVHLAQASSDVGTTVNPGSGVLLARRAAEPYHAPTNPATMAAGTTSNVGGSQAHNNMQPYLALSFCIATQGVFPSRN